MDKKIRKYLWVGLLVLGIFFIGFLFGELFLKIISMAAPVKPGILGGQNNPVKKWVFVNPLLADNELVGIRDKSVAKLRLKVVNFINEQKIAHIDSVSIYFRDLNNGPWFGINEAEEFSPASLLKVPRMISILHDAEANPSILEKKIFIKDIFDYSIQYYKPDASLVVGKTYTTAELISLMILYSDNAAAKTLEQVFGNESLLKFYDDLGIKEPVDGSYRITIRNYASFFRILYSTSYLGADYSEQALKLLSRTTFDKGLRVGVPASIIVAHKFGERAVIGSTTKQLHDCGIVYYPNKPYLLCVMTRSGSDSFDKMAAFIGRVSKIIYETVREDDGLRS